MEMTRPRAMKLRAAEERTMTEDPRDQRADTATTEAGEAQAPVRPVTAALPTLPGLQALDLGPDSSIGMVCDIDDPDCNPMAFAGTSGAPASTGNDEA